MMFMAVFCSVSDSFVINIL